MQLVGGRVVLLDGMKDRRYDEKEVEERFGVPPSQLLDLRALAGDPSDNIPGVKGIGAEGRGRADPAVGGSREPARARRRGRRRSARARRCSAGGAGAALEAARDAAQRRPAPAGARGGGAAGAGSAAAARARSSGSGFSRLLEGLGSEGASRAAAAGATAVRRIESLAELDALVAELRALPALALCRCLRRRRADERGPGGPRLRARARSGPPTSRSRAKACSPAGSPPRRSSPGCAALFEGERALAVVRARDQAAPGLARGAGARARPRRPSTSSSRRSCSIPAARARSRRSRRSSSGRRCAAGRISPGAARRRARRARSRSSRWRPGPARRPAPRSASRSRSRASSRRPAWTRSTARRSSR